jgi:hypothetical protein
VTLARYALGLLLAGLALSAVAAGSWALRARLLPSWSGAPARLAEVIIGVSLVTGVAEALGVVGLFRLAPMVLGLATAGVAAWRVGRRPTKGPAPRDEPAGTAAVVANRLGRGALVVALVATASVVAAWSARTVAALHHGMDNPDTLWYHLPHAARFVQEGSITGLHFVDARPLVVFYPANSALLHALGILFFGNDLLSPLLNMGWLALALLAAWCIGSRFGVAPVTLTGVAVALGTPGLVATQPGGGYDDVVGLALLLASVAILIHAAQESEGMAQLAVAGLAAGLAMGTKTIFVAPVAALSLGIVALAPLGQRMRRTGVWLLAVGLAGGFWYARNLVVVGNPLPNLGVHLGPLRLRSYPVGTSTLAEFLFDRRFLEEHLLPDLRVVYGPAWVALLGLVAAGLILAAATRSGRRVRVLALVGAATAVAYVFTPQPIGRGQHALSSIVYQLRLASTVLVFGLALLALVPAVTRGRRAWWLLTAFLLVLAATQLDASVWPTDFFEQRFAAPIGGLDAVVGLAVGVATLIVGAALLYGRDRLLEWRSPAAVAAACLVLMAGGFGLQQLYLNGRYTDTVPMPRIYRWARHVHNERIAVVGTFVFLQYPLYGEDLSNYVQYVGTRGPHGAFKAIRQCAAWRRALNAGHYSYVVTGPVPAGAPDATPWTASDHAATLVIRESRAFSLFRLNGRLDPAGCSRLASPTHGTKPPPGPKRSTPLMFGPP